MLTNSLHESVDWNYQFDVVVVGSGAGGMTAALIAQDLGLSTLVIEKSSLIGGTTAVSAGVIWIPNNPQMKALDYPDSTEEALRYLEETIGEYANEEKIRAYIESGPRVVSYLERYSKIAFRAAPLPDYYSNLPGGKDKYRALDPKPISARELEGDIKLLRPPHPQIVVAGLTFTTREVGTILRKEKGWMKLLLSQALKQYCDLPWRLKHKFSPRLTLGNALMARCLLSLRERDVPIWINTGLQEIVKDNEQITGVVVRQGGNQLRIKANRGVILAAGGFSSNPEMRRKFLTRVPDVKRSVAPDTNCGDAIEAGLRIGASIDLMDEAWWIPVYRLNSSQLTCGMFMERAFPGCIIVNKAGKRYMNDAANYDDSGRAMINARSNHNGDEPSYFIFDGRFRRKYMAGPLMPSPPIFDAFLSREVRNTLIKAKDLPTLAKKINLDPVQFENTIERFNRQAAEGKDSDFGRGEETYERHYSDPAVGPNSTMAPVMKAPFYAIPIYPGDIGTKGGLVTDRDARVIDSEGKPVRGLYAVGSTSASIMGRTYPGGGVTIGPAMIFGARAAMHLADKKLGE